MYSIIQLFNYSIILFSLSVTNLFSQTETNPPPCNQVSYLCNISNFDYTFPNGHLISLSGTTFINAKIKVEGELIIDANTNFYCCFFKMESGSKITVNANKQLRINKSELKCGPWEGIIALSNNNLFITNNYFSDFNVAISIVDPFHLTIQDNIFDGGYLGTGILLENVDATQMHRCFIAENSFSSCPIGIDVFDCNSASIGYYSYDNNTFDECGYGIQTNSSWTYVQKSTFNSCIRGITTLEGEEVDPGFISCSGVVDDPNQYTFNNCTWGILAANHNVVVSNCHYYGTNQGNELLFNSGGKLSNCTYENYKYNVPANFGGRYFAASESSNLNLVDNTIKIWDIGWGVYANLPSTCVIQNNNYFEETGNFTSSNVFLGTKNFLIDNDLVNFNNYFNNTLSNDIHDNTFIHADPQVHITAGKDNKLCSNTFDGTEKFLGVYNGLKLFNGMNSTQMGDNTFKNFNNGTAFSLINADIGLQDHLGNKWETSNQLSAKCEGNPTKSRFNVNPATNLQFLPATRNPQSGWFFPQTQGLKACLRTPLPLGFDGLLDDNDNLEISGNYESSPLNEWLQTLSTWSTIHNNPGLLSNPIVEDYYDSYIGTNIEKIVLVGNLIETAQINSEVSTQLENLNADLNSINEQIASINEILQNGPDPELELQKANLAQTYATKLAEYKSTKNDWDIERLVLFTEAIVINNSIVSGNNYDLHEKFISNLIIQKASIPSFAMSNTIYNEVINIANLCYEQFGLPVLKAQQLLKRNDYSVDMHLANCNNQIKKGTDKLVPIQSVNILQSNNRIEVLEEIKEIKYLSLLDINGKELVKSNSNILEVSSVPRGIYLIQLVESSTGITRFQKIIL